MILVANLQNKREQEEEEKKYMLDLVLLNVQFLLFYPLQLGLCVCEHVYLREGEREEGLFHISHDKFCLQL